RLSRDEQHRRDHTDERPPDHGHPARRLGTPLLRQRAHHERCRVGAGDEEDRDEEDQRDARDDRERQVAEDAEQHLLRRIHGEVSALHLLVDRSGSEDREPHERDHRRHHDHDRHELTQRAATRDLRDEHAHEGRPRDPPRPVEDRPAGQERLRRLALRARPRDHHGEVGEELRGDGGDHVQDQQRRPDEEHEEREDDGRDRVDVRQRPDALRDARDRRGDERGGEHGDDGDEHPVAQRPYPGDDLDPVSDLQRAEAERGGGAEERHDDGEDVDGPADHPGRAVLAEERSEDRRDQRRASTPIRAIGDRGPDERIERPRLWPPVVEHLRLGGVHRLERVRLDGPRRRALEEGERLGGAPEDQAD
ncbi:hypothetical protein ABE10_03250, partial [Bacillus toyonensis]|nr:hypothetical protein [Bacillus toyonensis]